MNDDYTNMNDDYTKQCNICLEELPADAFYSAPTTYDGLSSSCKACVKDRYRRNRRKMIERSKAYYRENKERILKRKRERDAKNREKAAAYNKAYYEKNKAKIAERRRKSRGVGGS